jgi:purine-cytosine permease-like protein
MLAPAGRSGKFILVILSFSVIGTCSLELYTIANDIQILIPKAHKVPRFVWVIITSGIILGVAIGAVRSFYASLVGLMYFIGYFSLSYVAIALLEWAYFRKANPASYDHAIWDNAKELPLGIAATIAFFLPWALVGTFVTNHTFLILKEANFLLLPCMDETWYTGTIAKKSGDHGFEVAGILSIIFYIPIRHLEIKWSRRTR